MPLAEFQLSILFWDHLSRESFSMTTSSTREFPSAKQTVQDIINSVEVFVAEDIASSVKEHLRVLANIDLRALGAEITTVHVL